MASLSFLFLQGVNTPFFPRLADGLSAAGHRVFRINFNTGDAVYWGKRPAWSFRDRIDQLPSFLHEKITTHGITDIVLFGDRRPIHLPITAADTPQRARVHVFEEGYFRPYWVTLERNGVNANSRVPRDVAWIRQAAKQVPDYGDGQPFNSTLRIRALHDMAYHLCNVANLILFPRYRTHRPFISGVEYLGWGQRFAQMPLYERQDRRVIERLLRNDEPFYLLPLQLDSDAQIREHSAFDHMSEVIELVVKSFARHAPPQTRLVIKNHPLDTGFVNYRRLIRQLGHQFQLAGRVDYLESGNLDLMLPKARGLVTVNSTTGLASLAAGCPTLTLSNPIYNLEGLTFKGTLDAFWRDASPPDPVFFKQFRNVLIHTTQVNGGFYSKEGIEMAVRNAIPVLTSRQSPLESLQKR
jgi:capsular polysaccharide export protein